MAGFVAPLGKLLRESGGIEVGEHSHAIVHGDPQSLGDENSLCLVW